MDDETLLSPIGHPDSNSDSRFMSILTSGLALEGWISSPKVTAGLSSTLLAGGLRS